jgi:hypothetical protein
MDTLNFHKSTKKKTRSVSRVLHVYETSINLQAMKKPGYKRI